MAKASKAQLEANARYRAKHKEEVAKYWSTFKRVEIKLHPEKDAEIIEKLESVESKQGYIKDLILKDILEEKKKIKENK